MVRTLLLLALVACEAPGAQSLAESWSTVQMEDGAGNQVRRLEVGAGSLGTKLVLVGGFSASMTEGLPITMDVLTYDTLTGEWAALPPAPVAWTHANVAAVGSVVYLLGGLDGRSFVAEGEAYKLETAVPDPQWEAIESLPAGQERGAAAVVVDKGHVFLLGGASTDGPLGSSLDFDVGAETGTSPWSRYADLPTPRSHAAAIRRADGTLILAGGLGDLTTARPLADVYALPLAAVVRPPEVPTWQLREAMPTARGGCAYGNLYGRLVCAGGEAGLDALDVVEIYDPTLDTWETGDLDPSDPARRLTSHLPLPEPRAGARGAVIGNQLYVPGGSATLAFEPTDSLFVFAPLAPN